MTGYDGEFVLGLPRPDYHIPAAPVTAADLSNPYRWLLILPGSDEARRRIVAQGERAERRFLSNILGELYPDRNF